MTVITNIFQEYCACRECGSKMPLEERKNERAGLTTKFALICSNKSCSFYTSPLYFHTTPKQGQSYDINTNSVLASRLIDKGRSGFRKLCGVLGLTSPISKKSFATTTKLWENVTRDLKETKFQNFIEKVKSVKKDMMLLLPILLMLQQVLMALGHRGDGLQIKVSYWLSQKRLVKFWTSCLNAAQVLSAPRWKKKKLGQVWILEYLDCYILHEPQCLKNHEGSP